MFALKRVTAFSVLGLLLCGGLFAQNGILDTYFDGDELNRRVRNYTINVSNLIPDSTTLSNVWSAPPSATFMYGIGINGSITLLDRRKVSTLIDTVAGFGGSSHVDLSQFPEAIPFLPGAAFDVRGGFAGFDVGLCGMWVDSATLSEDLGTSFLGDGSNFSYRSFGFDLRTVLIRERSTKILFNLVTIPSTVALFLPTVTFQAGYYFTWFGFGIESGNEKVHADFRNDSYLFALQASYGFLPIITPYFGMKLIFSKTDSGFTWETDRPVMVSGGPNPDNMYPDGARYTSGGVDGDTFAYFQLYGGLGLSISYPHLVTLGFVYNVGTEHFGINLGVRYIMGN